MQGDTVIGPVKKNNAFANFKKCRNHGYVRILIPSLSSQIWSKLASSSNFILFLALVIL